MKWLRRLDDAAGVRVDTRPMPGQSPEDQALIAKYYRAFPRRPIKGEHGGGGIIGNRRDLMAARLAEMKWELEHPEFFPPHNMPDGTTRLEG